MTWIEDNKDLGPWNFVEQLDKWGYINNPSWTSDPAHSDKHLPCGHWHKELVPSSWRFSAGEWVAAQSQIGTSYVYLYDIGEKAVIRLETLRTMHPRILSHIVVKEILTINALYDLDASKGYGNPGAQRGGYCMDKDGSTLWYLFRDAGTGNCELVEVDISQNVMSVTRRTSFSGLLLGEDIQDGCSDSSHTYWCTNLISGRIIKIRNSDHVIVDDHLFSFYIPLDATSLEGIQTIDVKGSSLYWNYALNHLGCFLSYNSCMHYIKSDTDFNIDVNIETCGNGVATPQWANLIRIYDDRLYQHRSYWPSYGTFEYRLFTYNLVSSINQQYLQNILGIYNGRIFTLMSVNSLQHPAYLYCLGPESLSEFSNKDVSYETGQTYPPNLNWNWTSVSALNLQTGIIIISRYDFVGKINRLSCFRADEDLELLSDVGLWYMERGGNLQEILDEPQVWTL